jgi:hypothetical protein
MVNKMNNSKIFTFAAAAISAVNTTLTQGINSNLSDKELAVSVIGSALQNVYNIKDELLFKAVSVLNPSYRPNASEQNDTMLDMAIMMLATEVVKQVYFLNNQMPNEKRNRELCPSMPLELEEMWRIQEWVRDIRFHKKLTSDLSDLTLKEKTKLMEQELANAEGGCAGGACKL